MGTWTLIVPLACIVAAAILLILASRGPGASSQRRSHAHLAEAEPANQHLREAERVHADRRERRR